ncbi:MAG: VCBS repeat-containing protein, partial [Bacteroidia bacterium]|nr:VCBS repeat-containing protein [Bacteroidia bacterium]
MKTIQHKLLLIVFVITNQLVQAQINSSSFSAYTNLAVSANGTINAATGDLDGDGKLDLVTANEATGVLSIFKNTSSLNNISFASRVDSVVSNNLGFVHLVDLNGDGKLDIVASTSVNNTVVVYKNVSTLGNILLGAKQTFAVGGTNAWGMWFGDLDGDNKTDIVTSNSGGGSYTILRNTSTALVIGFATASVITAPALISPSQVIIADLDGDNKNDIVFFNNSGNNLVIYKNITTSIGTIVISSTSLTVATNSGAHRGDIADIDGDNKPDIVASNYFSNNSSIFRNTSTVNNISFATKVDFAATSNVNTTLLRDIDNDGKPDLIQSFGTGTSSRVGIYQNFCNAGTINTASFGSRVDFVVGNEPRGLTIGDLDNDGKLDIITANYYSTNLSILKNTTIPSNGLVAYYPFNGNAGDSSGFGNHGTLGTSSAAPVLTSDRFGQLNSAYYFDGNTDIITVTKSAALQPNNRLTLSAWIKSEVKTGTAWNTILTYRHTLGSAPFNSYVLTTNNASPYNSKWMFGLTDASTSTLHEFVSKDVRVDNQWIHICATYDGAKVSIYKNAVLDTSFN